MITSSDTEALFAFFSQFADTVRLDRMPDSKARSPLILRADGHVIGTLQSGGPFGGWLAVLETPVTCDTLTAPNLKDVIGLALRTANQLCAKSAFQSW